MSLAELTTETHTPHSIALPIDFIDEVAQSQSINEVLDAAARWLPHMVVADRASIALNLDDKVLRLYAIQGNHAVAVNELLPINQTLIGDVFRKRASINSKNLVTREEIDCKILAEGGMKSSLVVPLTSGGECFGTLNVASETPGHYGEQEVTLLGCVANWIASHVRIYRHIEHEQMLAETDPLTDLLNRSSFINVGQRVYDDWRDDAVSFIVATLELDDLRNLNDQFGHEGGDYALVELAKALRTTVREVDHVARLGGQEFAIILENMHPKNAQAWAQRLTDTIASLEMPYKEQTIRFTVSVGIAAPRVGDDSIDPIMLRAEHALSDAKATGTSSVAIAE